jgi:hypothetical protein
MFIASHCQFPFDLVQIWTAIVLFVLTRNRDERRRGCEIRCHMVIFFKNKIFGRGVGGVDDLLADWCDLLPMVYILSSPSSLDVIDFTIIKIKIYLT